MYKLSDTTTGINLAAFFIFVTLLDTRLDLKRYS